MAPSALDTVPFGLRLDSGTVSMKAFLQSPDDVLRLGGGTQTERPLAATNPLRLFQSGAPKERNAKVGR